MAIIEADATIASVRIFRDRDGHPTGVYVSGELRPQTVEGSQDEPSFSGESYFRFELFMDNPREIDNLQQGRTLLVTVDVPVQGGQ